MPAAGTVRGLLRRAGVEVVARQPRNFPRLRRPLLLEEEQISVVLDVGANTGQWVDEVRGAGYSGRVVSFEPGADAFAVLQQRAAADSMWDCIRVALGDEDRTATLRVTANSVSSSLLPIAEVQTAADDGARETGNEEIEERRLDSLDVITPDDRAYL